MDFILIFPVLLSLAITLIFIPAWIRKAEKINLTGKDINKKIKKDVAESGGIVVLFGFILGILFYIAIKTFILRTDLITVEIFALITTILIAGIIGFIDDILGWIKGGLSAKFRIFLLFIAAIPLMVINSGESSMMGVDLGLLYPLLFIPIGIIGAASTFNLLAGYNGLETSQSILILSALAIVTYLADKTWLSLICLIMVASLLAFYFFNKYPAKVFPGDVLTYSIGALIAVMAILGNIEKIAVFFFIPYILETGLKLRGGLKKQSFGRVKEDSSLDLPYRKIYGLEHLSILILKKFKRKVYETDVVFLINLFQVIIIILGFALFGGQYLAIN
jgi:UDP-N-acetylglucosamine--dolichyl-phosphate N-acetylglucosaminephosphotransferase